MWRIAISSQIEGFVELSNWSAHKKCIEQPLATPFLSNCVGYIKWLPLILQAFEPWNQIGMYKYLLTIELWWSHVFKCIVKTYMTQCFTKCYFFNIRFILYGPFHNIHHIKIKDSNILKCHSFLVCVKSTTLKEKLRPYNVPAWLRARCPNAKHGRPCCSMRSYASFGRWTLVSLWNIIHYMPCRISSKFSYHWNFLGPL